MGSRGPWNFVLYHLQVELRKLCTFWHLLQVWKVRGDFSPKFLIFGSAKSFQSQAPEMVRTRLRSWQPPTSWGTLSHLQVLFLSNKEHHVDYVGVGCVCWGGGVLPIGPAWIFWCLLLSSVLYTLGWGRHEDSENSHVCQVPSSALKISPLRLALLWTCYSRGNWASNSMEVHPRPQCKRGATGRDVDNRCLLIAVEASLPRTSGGQAQRAAIFKDPFPVLKVISSE